MEDILDDLITMLAKGDDRYKCVRASQKKCRNRRYKSLYDTFHRVAARFDKEQKALERHKSKLLKSGDKSKESLDGETNQGNKIEE
jgi:hypothetical protein